MYNADLVRSGSERDGTEGNEYYRVTRDDGSFVGCMVSVPVTIEGRTRKWWYTALELIGVEKEPVLSPEACLVRLIKEYKRRNTK